MLFMIIYICHQTREGIFMKVIVFWVVFSFGFLGSLTWLDIAVKSSLDQIEHKIDRFN